MGKKKGGNGSGEIEEQVLEQAAGSGEGEDERPSTIASDPAPTWMLSAANRFDLLAMVMVVAVAREGKLGEVLPHRMREMEERLREFEMYEERHR